MITVIRHLIIVPSSRLCPKLVTASLIYIGNFGQKFNEKALLRVDTHTTTQ